MKKFSHWIVKHRVLVLILAVVLAIPSYFMYKKSFRMKLRMRPKMKTGS